MKLREYFVRKEKKKKTLFNKFFSSVSVFDARYVSTMHNDYFLTMFLLPFWALNISVVLLSMQGQKTLRIHQKYHNLCSEDEQRSYR